jgi:heparan-alpha-glucosaminide N-acetyltransferase
MPETLTPETKPASSTGERLLSLDAFRGFVMLMMASAALGVPTIAKQFPDSAVWQHLSWHCSHAEWTSCSAWDLIQPAFMFMVGVALAFSVPKRVASGQSFGKMFSHALWRALALVLLAVFLTSASAKRTDWIFTNVLAQIGLGYPLLFLLAFTRVRTQAIAAAGILLVSWAAFALWPVAPPGFDWQSVGVSADWPHLTGFAAHWEKNANIATAFDQWFLNLFPRDTPFVYNKGGYTTLNFVPSLATMIFGLITGNFLRGPMPLPQKLKRIVLTGILALAVGWLLDFSGLCPMVKRIWTPSFALFSTGWVLLLLAGFSAAIEGAGWRRWAFPLVVAGLNPITLYTLWQLMGGFIKDSFRRHFGAQVFDVFGEHYVETLQRGTILLILWLILLWMYRRKIVVRI